MAYISGTYHGTGHDPGKAWQEAGHDLGTTGYGLYLVLNAILSTFTETGLGLD